MKMFSLMITILLISAEILLSQANTGSAGKMPIFKYKQQDLSSVKNGLNYKSEIPGIISIKDKEPKIKGIVPISPENRKPAIQHISLKTNTGKSKSAVILEDTESFIETLKAGEHAAFSVDTRTKTLTFTPPDYTLSSVCYDALEVAPKWIRDDLKYKFRLLKQYALDDEYAELILSAVEKNEKYVDETAFLVANIALESLINARFRQNIEWLIEIPEFIYNIEDSLKYVRTVEYGDYSTGDYYTTTEYRIKNGKNGEIIWSEIPRDIYYWYLVHPKIYYEGLWTADNTNDPQQRTYGYSWHEYIWYNPDPQHDYTQVNMQSSVGSVGTIPRFGELMQQPDVLWDREKTHYLFGREFGNEDHALNLLGNWASRAVPSDPIIGEPRAIHPNQILENNRGRCGEDTYLIVAACRTALIPIIHRGTIREDHVWGAFYDRGWNHFEFFRGGLAYSGWGWTNLMEGGAYEELAPDYWVISFIEGHRPDTWVFNHTADYTETCTLRMGLMDKNNVPADGVNLRIYSSPGHNSDQNDQGVGLAGNQYSDHFGFFTLPAGDRKKYYFQAYHKKFGYLPAQDRVYVLVAGMSVPEKVYDIGYFKLENLTMPVIDMNENDFTPDNADYGVKLKWKAEEIITTKNIMDSQQSTFHYKKTDFGNVSFFILDSINYYKFNTGKPFDSYEGAYYTNNTEAEFGLPGEGLWYIVFSNGLLQDNAQRLTASCELYENHSVTELSNMEIIGPDELFEGTSDTYTCELSLSDGTEVILTNDADWNIVKSSPMLEGAYFDGNVLHTGSVFKDEEIEIQASFNYNHMKPYNASKKVIIKNQTSSSVDIHSTLQEVYLSSGPNPFNNKTIITAELPETQRGSLKVISPLGGTASVLAENKIFRKGVNVFDFDASNLPQGIYYCVLDAGIYSKTLKLIIVR